MYYYLLAHKEDLLVPLMRGATNKSISTDRLERLRIPMPPTTTEQRRLVSTLVRGYERIESLKRDLSSATARQSEALATLKAHF